MTLMLLEWKSCTYAFVKMLTLWTYLHLHNECNVYMGSTLFLLLPQSHDVTICLHVNFGSCWCEASVLITMGISHCLNECYVIFFIVFLTVNWLKKMHRYMFRKCNVFSGFTCCVEMKLSDYSYWWCTQMNILYYYFLMSKTMII